MTLIPQHCWPQQHCQALHPSTLLCCLDQRNPPFNVSNVNLHGGVPTPTSTPYLMRRHTLKPQRTPLQVLAQLLTSKPGASSNWLSAPHPTPSPTAATATVFHSAKQQP